MNSAVLRVGTLVLALSLVSASAFAKDFDGVNKNSEAYRRGIENPHGDNPYTRPGGDKYETFERAQREARESRHHDYSPSYPSSWNDHSSSWPSYNNSYDRNYDSRYDSRHDSYSSGSYSGSGSSSNSGSSGSTGGASCAPETVQSNVKATDKALAKLAGTEFRGNATFAAVTDDIASLKDGKFKVNEYLRLAGVKNPKDAKEVLNFLYGRGVEKQNIERAATLLQISPSQAEKVIEQIKSNLRAR